LPCPKTRGWGRALATPARPRIRHGAANVDRATHNETQRTYFDACVPLFEEPLPEEVQQRLDRIAASVPDLGPESRIVDVGSGTGCLVGPLQRRGVRDILAVDLSPSMLASLEARHGQAPPLGNDLAVRTWCGDVVDLPDFALQGSDAVFFNACFGNVADQRLALLRPALLLRPGGRIVLSHPLGCHFVEELHEQEPHIVLHALPDRSQLDALVQDLPLRVEEFVDEDDFFLAVLSVPPLYQRDGLPCVLEGPVVRGFGRGSKEMGVPTANIDPTAVADETAGWPAGVYYGWARLVTPGMPEEEAAVRGMVMNVGVRPTIGDGTGLSVEVHLLGGTWPRDFYGETLRVAVIGYLRPEMKFPSLGELVAQIRADIALATNMLATEGAHAARSSLQETV